MAQLATEPQWLALAHLAHHVHGQHLGAWDAGRDCLEAMTARPGYDAAGPSGAACRRWLASLALSQGAPPAGALARLDASDRIRVLAMAAANLAENRAAPDLPRAAALWAQALDAAERSGLPDTDPMHRSLAATGNGLACAMEERRVRSPAERALMLSAAQAARAHWERAGTWLEVERAEYRLAMSWLQAGDAAQACRHAQACLDGIGARAASAFERYFGWEAMALARRGLGAASAADAAAAIESARAAYAELGPADRAACDASLQRLLAPAACTTPL